jgi:hypothetical protein
MKLEDMRVGAFIKCTKPTKTGKFILGNTFIFEIIEKLPNNQWKLETMICARGAIKDDFKYRSIEIVVDQKTLQHNFKLDKFNTVKRDINISLYANGMTFAKTEKKIASVGLYHEDKYDEFVGAVEALAKLYGRKSPFDEIEELKEAARAAEEPIEATEVSEEWSTIEKEESTPHSPVDDMDLTPPLEAGCLVKLKNPYTDKLKGKWFKVTCLGLGTAVISVFLEPNKITLKAFREKDLEVVCERYRNIWDSKLKYQFGDRVVLTQTGFNVKRKSYGTVIDWRQYSNENYYIVHWDDKNARFVEGKEEFPEYCLLPLRYE